MISLPVARHTPSWRRMYASADTQRREKIDRRPRPALCSESAYAERPALMWARSLTEEEIVDLQLTDKKAIVTGASRGIGRAIARQLALEGCDVAICARTEVSLKASSCRAGEGVGPRSTTRPASAARRAPSRP